LDLLIRKTARCMKKVHALLAGPSLLKAPEQLEAEMAP
jgi:hypothetical protein